MADFVFLVIIFVLMEEKELEFNQWLYKLNERLTLANVKIKSGEDLSDEETELLYALFPLWYRGYIIYKTHVLSGNSHSVRQPPLFGDKTSVKP